MLNQKILDTKLMEHEIVEQGSSGGWTWRKWSDGTLEQWYQGNIGTYSITTARGSLYSGSELSKTFPVSFVDSPVISVNATLDSTAYVIFPHTTKWNGTGLSYRIICTSSISNQTYINVQIYAIGKWK